MKKDRLLSWFGLPLLLHIVSLGFGLSIGLFLRFEESETPRIPTGELITHNMTVGIAYASLGVLTLGIATAGLILAANVFNGLAIGTFLANVTAATAAQGLLHAPFELVGFAFCASAGLLTARRVSKQIPRLHAGLRRSALELSAGLFLIFLAGLIETRPFWNL